MDAHTRPRPFVVTCPVCTGTGRNPEAPAAIAEDERTCLACCLPDAPLHTAPGQLDGARLLRTVEALGLRRATEALRLPLRHVVRVYSANLAEATRAGLLSFAGETFSARVAACVAASSERPAWLH